MASVTPFLSSAIFFLTRPRLFSNLLVSMDAARLLTDLPGLASGLIIHHEDFPVPSFWTLMKRLWRERLCRMEFWKRREDHMKALLRTSLGQVPYQFLTDKPNCWVQRYKGNAHDINPLPKICICFGHLHQNLDEGRSPVLHPLSCHFLKFAINTASTPFPTPGCGLVC